MKRWLRLAPLMLFVTLLPAFAQNPVPDVEPPPLLLIEIQTGSADSAAEEFVELFNRTDEVLAADELRLQYRSATGSAWLTKVQLDGGIEPRGRYLIATSHLAETANVVNGLGLAASGGHLRLVQLAASGEEVLDEMAWGSAQFAVVAPALAPADGQSLKRLVDEDGAFTDTGNDSLDFLVSDTPSPQSALPIEPDEPPTEPDSNGPDEPGTDVQNSDGPANQNQSFAKLEISELFIDPDQPLTDAEDEFVEVFNPGPEAVDLERYVIQTGSKYSYSFTLPDIVIKPKQYLAFFSLDSGLALSNSGGAARLLAPTKSLIYEAPAYEKAKPGTAWANIGGRWQWTGQPTPNAPNAAASDGPSGEDLAGARGLALSRGRVLGDGDERNIYQEPPGTTSNQVDTAVVAGVGAMALLYAGNEYRYDAANFFHKVKRYLAARRAGRP
jgi:hypothetical protein